MSKTRLWCQKDSLGLPGGRQRLDHQTQGYIICLLFAGIKLLLLLLFKIIIISRPIQKILVLKGEFRTFHFHFLGLLFEGFFPQAKQCFYAQQIPMPRSKQQLISLLLPVDLQCTVWGCCLAAYRAQRGEEGGDQTGPIWNSFCTVQTRGPRKKHERDAMPLARLCIPSMAVTTLEDVEDESQGH